MEIDTLKLVFIYTSHIGEKVIFANKENWQQSLLVNRKLAIFWPDLEWYFLFMGVANFNGYSLWMQAMGVGLKKYLIWTKDLEGFVG